VGDLRCQAAVFEFLHLRVVRGPAPIVLGELDAGLRLRLLALLAGAGDLLAEIDGLRIGQEGVGLSFVRLFRAANSRTSAACPAFASSRASTAAFAILTCSLSASVRTLTSLWSRSSRSSSIERVCSRRGPPASSKRGTRQATVPQTPLCFPTLALNEA
jgi:hypothetical protein